MKGYVFGVGGLGGYIDLIMAVRREEQLRTIEELSDQNAAIPKACTLGVVIDATSAYFDENQNRYVKKIKIVDDTYNTERYNPHQKYSYCTIFFYAPKIEDLPNPRTLADLLYLRRFSFGKYNDNFQGHHIEAPYCSWALIAHQSSPEAEAYQSNRVGLSLNDEEKYPNLAQRVDELREFGRKYLATTSLITILPTGIVPKDKDHIVQVLKKNENGYRLRSFTEEKELTVRELLSFAEEGEIAKLRSVARIEANGVVVANNFTSLVTLPEWTHDAQIFRKKAASRMDVETEGEIYTTLAELASLPLNQCENKRYYVKVEVASSTAEDFQHALWYYDSKNHTLDDKKKKGSEPVYKFNLVCLDDSISKKNNFAEIHVFSYDGQGGDFVSRVHLQDLSDFSNFSEESKYFKARLDDLLSAQSVRMTVEVLGDGKGNRMLRALSIA